MKNIRKASVFLGEAVIEVNSAIDCEEIEMVDRLIGRFFELTVNDVLEIIKQFPEKMRNRTMLELLEHDLDGDEDEIDFTDEQLETVARILKIDE